jgi:hypothetical protein
MATLRPYTRPATIGRYDRWSWPYINVPEPGQPVLRLDRRQLLLRRKTARRGNAVAQGRRMQRAGDDVPPDAVTVRSRLRAIASAYVWSPVRWRVYVAINLSTTPLPVRRCYQYANITPARGRDTYTWPHRHPSLARLNFVVSIEIHSYADHNTSQKERRRRKDHGHRKASAK